MGTPPTIKRTNTFTTSCKSMYTTIYAKLRINMDTHGEVMSNIGVKQGCSLSPTLLAYTLMNLKHIWMRPTKICCVYLIQQLSFFSILMMLLSCLKL